MYVCLARLHVRARDMRSICVSRSVSMVCIWRRTEVVVVVSDECCVDVEVQISTCREW
jgi:hypothetical protein